MKLFPTVRMVAHLVWPGMVEDSGPVVSLDLGHTSVRVLTIARRSARSIQSRRLNAQSIMERFVTALTSARTMRATTPSRSARSLEDAP